MAKKLPSQMNTAELWHWHAEVYAFRRVVLDAPVDQRTSPCDPGGVWFDAGMVADAERRLRARRAPKQRADEEEMQREGRAIANEWARRRGYEDLEHYRLAERIDYTEALVRICRSILASKRMPGEPDAEFDPVPEAKAREFAPTADQLRAGREELVRGGWIDPGPEDAPAGPAEPA